MATHSLVDFSLVLWTVMLRTAISTWLVACVFLSCGIEKCRAQAVDDVGLWTALFAQDKFKSPICDSDRLKWWFDGHLRFLDDTDGFNQSLIRPGIGWTVNEQSTLWAGYAWIHTSPISGIEFDEHRLWQQWTWAKGCNSWDFAHRARFEERFLETSDDVGLRYRQLLRAQYKLPTLDRTSLVAWDEAFFHLNDTDWGANAGFDQNRAFVGVGYIPTAGSNWRVEVGYLNQVINVSGSDDRVNHLLSINFYRGPKAKAKPCTETEMD